MIVGDKTKCLRWLIDAPDKEYKITEFHPKRTLTANAFYWRLLGQLAELLGTSNDELHNELLRRYSKPFPLEDGVVTITLKSDIPVTALPGHWMEYKSNGEFTAYIRLKGSSDMDSKEFSRLVDGLVSECKEVGIETMSTRELERLRGYIGA